MIPIINRSDYKERISAPHYEDCNDRLKTMICDNKRLRRIWGLTVEDPTDITKLMVIQGIGRKKALLLYYHDIRNIGDVVNNRISILMKIPGIGVATAKQIKSRAKVILEDGVTNEYRYSNGDMRYNRQKGQTREW